MTITHEPVHRVIHKPRYNVRIDTTFWQHRSIFAGSQEQLNELKREADERAAARARGYFAEYFEAMRAQSRPSIFEAHRPAVRQLKAIIHVGLVPMLWAITTCRCGGRWPCNTVKQYLRHRLGWTVDITDELKALTKRLPRPTTRWARVKRLFARRGHTDGP